MTINDLTVNISHLDREALLSEWRWLTGATKLPVLATLAGDVFVQDSTDGSVHFLDVVEGRCTEIAPDGDTFQRLLSDREFVMRHLSVQLVAPLIRAGKVPAAGQILSWRHPPVLGGACSTDNLEATDISVHFSMLGQIWRQASTLPPGTPIHISMQSTSAQGNAPEA
ncbi:T6SS immunity protein Tdi1 domain-containing protein [Prosthecobacter sp.]|uniref:T6SS immunity protein Tdi1 domain-containing protein n=1 Tax=Prosthecobacter sp. TaxID=1965333 RepID=UPI0037837095